MREGAAFRYVSSRSHREAPAQVKPIVTFGVRCVFRFNGKRT